MRASLRFHGRVSASKQIGNLSVDDHKANAKQMRSPSLNHSSILLVSTKRVTYRHVLYRHKTRDTSQRNYIPVPRNQRRPRRRERQTRNGGTRSVFLLFLVTLRLFRSRMGGGTRFKCHGNAEVALLPRELLDGVKWDPRHAAGARMDQTTWVNVFALEVVDDSVEKKVGKYRIVKKIASLRKNHQT